MQKNTYKIYTLGCKVNQHDSFFIEKKLIEMGFVSVELGADLVIINTCAVTKTAISKAKCLLNKIKKDNSGAKIVLMGCWPKTHGEELEGFEVDLVWGVGDALELMKKISNFQFLISKQFPISNDLNKNKIKVRYFLKVQDGCEQFCSYCIIPYARGPLKSRDVDDVIAELKDVISQGAREIVLCGIHLGLYGVDQKEKTDLTTLIQKILKVGINNFGRLRLSSIEINEVTDELLKFMKNEKKLCKHLHVPLQAGSDKVLKLMNRPYNKKEIYNRLIEIKKIMPDISLTTDVIVGFPGETEEDFLETCKLVESIKFLKVHVFPYSSHEKTPASKFPNQVSSNDKKRRASILRKISRKLEKEYIDSFLGKEHEVIIEQIKDDKAIMKSEFYFDVVAPVEEVEKIVGVEKDKLKGMIFNWQGI